jgi:hypothetical protein
MLMDYHPTHRLPNCVASFPGTAPGGTCGAPLPASGQVMEKVVTSNFDSFGNATGVGTSARGAGTRSVGSNYGTDGYFPIVVTDANTVC